MVASAVEETLLLKQQAVPPDRSVPTRPSAITAAVLTALYGSASFANTPADSDAGGLQEVIVTASHREVSAQDLPISITAVTGNDLEKQGIADIAGLAHSMAGVSYTDKGPFGGVNGANLIIRGLNSETTSGLPAAASPVVPPVATYVDDTPLFFNLRLQDLDRVEVLRGPQGTLYGSGSLGGTVRFVQNPPDPKAFDAKLEGGVSDTAHTQQPNGDVNGMLNIPVTDTFAVRVNAGWSHDAGFINQPNLYVLDSTGAPVASQPGNLFSPPQKYSKKGVNSYEYRSARVAALWKPTDELRAQLSYYYQRSTADGFPYAATSLAAYNQPINPALQPSGNFTNPPLATQLYDAPVPAGVDRLSSAENIADGTHDNVDLVALTLTYDMGFATLTSASSWAHHTNQTTADETQEYINFPFFQSLYGQDPRTLIVGREALDDRPLTQELRLTSRSGGRFDWVTGLFFNDQRTDIQEHDFYPGYLDYYNACAPIYGQSIGDNVTPSYCGIGQTAYTPGTTTYISGIPIIKDQAYIGDFQIRFKDLAAFGELTGHITSAWSVTGGARVFKQTLRGSQQTGLLFDGSQYIANESRSESWRRALFKINTAYKFDATNLIYATWSQGFRRGSVNALPTSELGGDYQLPDALKSLQPDKADNYEIGVKGTVQNRFRYSAAIFDIQWHNTQEGLQLTPLVLPAAMNIGNAYSRGIETEFEALLTQHVSAQVSYTYDKTKLTSLNPLFVSPNVSAPPPAIGSPLPGTPKSSAAVSLEYGHVELFGGEWRYAVSGHYQSVTIPALSASALKVPGYTMVDTRLSFALSHWMTTLYVNNVTNNLGITSIQDPAIFGNRAQAIVSQPRTVGLTVGYSFKPQ
jgi:outer membrane receptor protein involved in Fe transport